MKTYPVIILTLFFSFTFLSFINSPILSENTTDTPRVLSMSYVQLLPSHIKAEDVISYELVKVGQASSIYEIKTKDGESTFQVLSIALLESLPSIAKYACLASIKNQKICGYVQKVGAALINIFKNDLSQAIEKKWNVRTMGDEGYASIYSDNYEDAEEGQDAFKESKKQTGFPWSAAVIRPYNNAAKRYGSGKD